MPDAPAFITEHERLTWRQYADSSDRLAGVLVAADISAASGSPSSCPTPRPSTSPSLRWKRRGWWRSASVRGLVTASCAISSARTRQRFDHARRAPRPDRRRRVRQPAGKTRPTAPPRHPPGTARAGSDHGRRRRRSSRRERAWRGRKLTADELWLVNSTSGTTGLPKCVMHHQNRWYYFHQTAVDVGGLAPRTTSCSAPVPAPFGFGQWTSHFTPTLLGAPAVVMERFDAEPGAGAHRARARHRARVQSARNSSSCSTRPTSTATTSPRCGCMFTGGEMIPYERARDFERRTGATVLNFYGSNESGFATATTIRIRPRSGCAPPAGFSRAPSCRLYDDDRNDVTAPGRGQPGSRGPAISFGYLDDPAANAQLFTDDGFVLHADEVTLDDEGYLTVVGRKSDIIIRGGKNISAPHVEDEVGAHPAVALAGCRRLARPRLRRTGLRLRRTGGRCDARTGGTGGVPDASAGSRPNTCRSGSSSWTSCPAPREASLPRAICATMPSDAFGAGAMSRVDPGARPSRAHHRRRAWARPGARGHPGPARLRRRGSRRAGGSDHPAVPDRHGGGPARRPVSSCEKLGRRAVAVAGRRAQYDDSRAAVQRSQPRARRSGRRHRQRRHLQLRVASRTSPTSSGTRCRPSTWAVSFAPCGRRSRPCAPRGPAALLATASMAGRGGCTAPRALRRDESRRHQPGEDPRTRTRLEWCHRQLPLPDDGRHPDGPQRADVRAFRA